ncbi:unnamed protein product, partial [Prunus brigantina]
MPSNRLVGCGCFCVHELILLFLLHKFGENCFWVVIVSVYAQQSISWLWLFCVQELILLFLLHKFGENCFWVVIGLL